MIFIFSSNPYIKKFSSNESIISPDLLVFSRICCIGTTNLVSIDRSLQREIKREILELSIANADFETFETICWQEWEQLLLNPDHILEFNTKGKIAISPVVESQIRHFFHALDNAFNANRFWKELKSPLISSKTIDQDN